MPVAAWGLGLLALQNGWMFKEVLLQGMEDLFSGAAPAVVLTKRYGMRIALTTPPTHYFFDALMTLTQTVTLGLVLQDLATNLK
jgi:hypothetical protein